MDKLLIGKLAMAVNDPYKSNLASKIDDMVIYKPELKYPVYFPKVVTKK